MASPGPGANHSSSSRLVREDLAMNRRSCLGLLILLAPRAVTDLRVVPQEQRSCSARKVEYGVFDGQYSGRISLRSVPLSDMSGQSGEKTYSEQHTMWQIPVEPDYMKAGPWSTTIYIGSDVANEVLRLSFLYHANGGAKIRWLNEKLVFGRVWWGRVYSTDSFWTSKNANSCTKRWLTTQN
jgi:hypothetical protein